MGEHDELTCNCGCQTWRVCSSYVLCSDCGHEVRFFDVESRNLEMQKKGEEEDEHKDTENRVSLPLRGDDSFHRCC